MSHEMKIRKIYFDKIKSGQKIYEIRLNDEKRQQIHVGDMVIFKNADSQAETIQAVVKDLNLFKSFEEMTTSISPKEIGFENSSIAEIVDTYHEFYTPENENKYGVLAIKLALV